VTPLGVASAGVQIAELLRWTLVNPVLARAEAAGVTLLPSRSNGRQRVGGSDPYQSAHGPSHGTQQ
jgi:hypothetical protein